MNIATSMLDLIGKTPLVYLNKLSEKYSSLAKIAVKLEFFNPSGSVKDRAAYAMLNKAEKDGLINKNTILVEATSGNTGIALALICSLKGFDLVLTMPESMSLERRALLNRLGAVLVLTPADKGMRGAEAEAKKIVEETHGAILVGQFINPANPEIHSLTTAEEIWTDTDGCLAAFVVGAGTGGTITGVGERLKKLNPKIKIAVVEPLESSILSGCKPGPHLIQGIGAGFVPSILNVNIFDEIIAVPGTEAIKTAKSLIKDEGIMAGISSGANVFAALQLAGRKEFKDKLIVTVACDTAERYLSTALFQ